MHQRSERTTRWICSLWLLGWAAAASASAQDVPGISLRDIAMMRFVTSAVVSPDGSLVAYLLAVPRDPFTEENGPAWSELHVVDLAGRSRPFVTGKVNISNVTWTPDGDFLAFTTRRGDDKQARLYLLPIDGGEARPSISHPSGVGAFEFSPDGKEIAFLATDPPSKAAEDLKNKGFNQEIYEEDWRPTKIWIAPLDGSAEPRALDIAGSVSAVKWHPTERKLAVVVAPTALVDDSYMYKRVQIVDADSSEVLKKIENPGKLGDIGWSATGTYLALISAADIHDPQEGRLMIVDAASGEWIDALPDYQAHIIDFSWLDDQQLLWLADDHTSTQMGMVSATGADHMAFPRGETILTGFDRAANGDTLSFVGSTPHHPNEVFIYDSALNQLRRLTSSNEWLGQRRLARQEVVKHTARDCLELEGILIYPLDHEPGKRYPLILCVHGGPEAHVRDGWITTYGNPGQYAASRGFAVFYPNYRGSTGRGVDFSKLGQEDAAGREFDDLVDAVDHLIEIGLVDGDRVGITGGSYGGYASAWGATYYSHRFAASVMFVGISNNISKVGTTDIPDEMYLVHHRKRLWDDWDYFAKSSPIKYVDRHRTPILIMHGKDDPRVHPSQSLELYRHLKVLGQAPARMVFYPNEGHGNRRAAARFDYSLRLMQWMEHYLVGPGGDPPALELDYDTYWK